MLRSNEISSNNCNDRVCGYYIGRLFISSTLLRAVLIRGSDITGAYRCHCNCMPTGHLTFYRPNASPNVMTTSTYRCLRNVCRPRLPEEISPPLRAAGSLTQFTTVREAISKKKKKKQKKVRLCLHGREKPTGHVKQMPMSVRCPSFDTGNDNL